MRVGRFIVAAALAAVISFQPAPGFAQSSRAEVEAIVKDYLAKNPEEVQRIVKDYLAKNPSVLQEALSELIKQRQPAAAAANADKTAAIKANAAALFSSPRQVTLGNRDGDVTLVEFFDYNCGYCKRALVDLLDLMKDDPKLKVVLKELPVLGPGSIEAARVAVAVRMQDASGEKYLAFHRALLSDRGRVDGARALAAARELGLDMARLDRDLNSDEVRLSLEESGALARALGIRGTPSYVIGDTVVVGAVGTAALSDRIKAVRK
jgi:protein-disulfide isomerase